MTFPDKIERTLHLLHPPEIVWTALTTPEALGTWFGDNGAEVDLRPGGQITMRWSSGDTATLTITRLEPPKTLAYTWPIQGLPDHDPRRTHVEFTLTPTDEGTTLTMTESGFGQLPDTAAFDGNTQGWTHELGELVKYLDGQA